MVHLYYGTDTIASRTKAISVASEIDSVIERFEAETYIPGSLQNAAEAVSLFGVATTYIVDSPSLNQVMMAELLGVMEALQTSPQTFIIVEGALTAGQIKSLKSYIDNIESFAKEKTDTFNTFAFADALANRDKKTLWILLAQSMRQGLSAEEIIGVLWWQIKSMRLALVTKSAIEAGMKEYPYNKAKRALRNFKEGEIEKLSHQLMIVYHQGHGGEKDILVGLEEWVLGV